MRALKNSASQLRTLGLFPRYTTRKAKIDTQSTTNITAYIIAKATNSIFDFMLNPLKNIVIIGDRILIKPLESSNKTGSGLYLPPSVKEHDAVHTGIVVRVGPGYPIPANQDNDAIFRGESPDAVKYMPLQVKEGDEALYLHANGYEIEVDNERYVIISQNAVLLVMRPEVPDGIDDIDKM